jgi:hypothetical protein
MFHRHFRRNIAQGAGFDKNSNSSMFRIFERNCYFLFTYRSAILVLVDKILQNYCTILQGPCHTSIPALHTQISLTSLKRTVSRDFRSSVFCTNNPPWVTDNHPKIFSNLVSISPRCSRICVDSVLCSIFFKL